APTDRESELTVLRPEGRRLLRVRLTSMPRAMVGERISAEFGFLLRDPEVQGGEASGRVGTTVPAIASVIRGGAADRAGLEAGDVILQVNEQPVLSRDGAREALADASPARRPRRRARRHSASRWSPRRRGRSPCAGRAPGRRRTSSTSTRSTSPGRSTT